MEPGFYTSDELSNDAYHSGLGVSNSGLKLIGSKTPAHFWAKYIDPDRVRESSTPAQMIGTAIHAAALEPDKFADEYIEAPFNARNAAGYKAWAAAQTKNIIMPADMVSVKGMHKSLYQHSPARSLLRSSGQFELSAYANDPETGVLVRARYDLLLDNGWAVDIKKCQDASKAGAAKAIGTYGYYHQDAFYRCVHKWLTGENLRGFAFIFVEESPPHAVCVYTLAAEDVMRGYAECRRNLNLYAECRRNDSWPGYGEGAVEIELNQWDRKRLDQKSTTPEQTP